MKEVKQSPKGERNSPHNSQNLSSVVANCNYDSVLLKDTSVTTDQARIRTNILSVVGFTREREKVSNIKLRKFVCGHKSLCFRSMPIVPCTQPFIPLRGSRADRS